MARSEIMPKVSIIVPIYNVENYLEECLDSILLQTLQDIEIICVNDGSTDKCGDILDVYANRDSRIRVVHKQNSGYGHSINVGYEIATGEYIGIVESDDFIKEDMYEKLYFHANKYKLDLVKANAIFLWDIIGVQRNSYNRTLDQYYNVVLKPDSRELMYKFFMNTWSGIYKKDFLDQYCIRHNITPGASYQDNGFWIQTLAFCKRAMWLKDAFYYYRQDNPMASVKSKGKVYSMAEEYDYVFNVINGKVGEIEEGICLYYKLLRHKGNFFRIDDTLKREFCNRIIDDYQKHKKYIENNKELVNWYEWIVGDPDKVCEEIFEKKKQIIAKLEEAKEIVIFGAGKRAEAVLIRLYNLNLFNKIKCVVVTDRKNQTKFGKYKVYNIKEFNDYDNNTLFIVGVSENIQGYKDIFSELEMKSIKNYIESTELVSYFYSVG